MKKVWMILAVAMLMLSACANNISTESDDNNGKDSTIIIPEPPSNFNILMEKNILKLTWDSSPSATNKLFAGYVLTTKIFDTISGGFVIYYDNMPILNNNFEFSLPKELPNNLYEFILKSKYTNGEVSSPISKTYVLNYNPYSSSNNPLNIEATNVNANIKIRWKNESYHNGYYLEYENEQHGGKKAITLNKNTANYLLCDIIPYVVYNITLYYLDEYGNKLDKSEFKWASSLYSTSSFGEELKLYINDSNKGSGLQLCNSNENHQPQRRKKASFDLWDLGLDTRNGIKFGSATKINGIAGNPATTLITEPILCSSLDEYYSSVPFNELKFFNMLIDIDLYKSDIVIVVKSLGNSLKWNYAKILIKRNSNGFLWGNGVDKYIKIEISYQVSAGLPYA